MSQGSIPTASTSDLSFQLSEARNAWLKANNVETISPSDEIYRYDKKQQQDMLAAKPWEKE